jgi:hypothetical protein
MPFGVLPASQDRGFELVRVQAPHFCAALILKGDRCIKAAPILRWCVNMRRQQLQTSFARKGWKASVIDRWQDAG